MPRLVRPLRRVTPGATPRSDAAGAVHRPVFRRRHRAGRRALHHAITDDHAAYGWSTSRWRSSPSGGHGSTSPGCRRHTTTTTDPPAADDPADRRLVGAGRWDPANLRGRLHARRDRVRRHARRAGRPVGACLHPRPRAPGYAPVAMPVVCWWSRWLDRVPVLAPREEIPLLCCSPCWAGDLFVPVGPSDRPTPWHPHHIAERYGLFFIIVLGETSSP